MKKFRYIGFLAGIILLNTSCIKQASLRFDELSCNNLVNPIGIEGNPYFSWTLKALSSNAVVTAYEVRVNELDLSEKLENGNENGWLYHGPELESGKKYSWQVQVWDEKGRSSGWSPKAWFVTGLPDPDWEDAGWIAFEELPDSMKIIPGVHGSGNQLGEKGLQRSVIPQFRKEFDVGKKVSEAYLFVSGLGHYTLSIDGEAPDDRFLAPGWTLYSKTCYYNAYDISNKLKPGKHTIGVTVGNGFFNVNRERYRKLVSAWGMPMMRMKLVIRYSDGSVEELVSDESWKTAPSPVTYTSIYGGEDFDARLLQEGWDQTGFDDLGWQNVVVVQGPGGVMRNEEDHPLRIMQSFNPMSVIEMPDGTFVYDFGQNASGIPEIRVSGSAGQTLRLTPGELLADNGYITQQASGGPMYFDYTGAKNTIEKWKPSFTYYGFRYMGLRGAVPAGFPNPNKKPVVEEAIFHHTRNSSPSMGSFRCSNELFNQIYDLIDWSVRSNLASVATDCPHREKLGWLEVPHLMGNSIQYAYDIQNLYNKIVDDMMDSQLKNGLIPDIAPEYVPFGGGFRDSPEWGSSAVILPWYLYLWYGDKRPMERAWTMMTRYVDYLESMSDEGIISHGLGDWFDLGQQSPGSSQLTPLALTATSIYYYDLSILSEMANLLGKQAYSEAYKAKAEIVKQAFLDRFYNSDTHVIATGSQTSYAMPLVVGLIDESKKDLVHRNLIAAIERDGFALTAGDIGFHYLVRALQDAGADDVIWKMNARDDVPGYGYQLKKGATALTESWPALRYVSNNHMMLGHLMEWLYSGIGGIRQAEGSVGYQRIIIDPQPVGDLSWAEVSHTCIRGEIYVRWEKKDDGVEIKIRVPVGVEAEVRFGGKALGTFASGQHQIIFPQDI